MVTQLGGGLIASPISRMGTSWSMAGGSLAERHDARRRVMPRSAAGLFRPGRLVYLLRLVGFLYIQMPPTVQAILAARIDRLSPDDKRLLQAAAVIGKNVPFGLLQILDHWPAGPEK